MQSPDPSAETGASAPRFDHLDGMRGVCALWVVGFHITGQIARRDVAALDPRLLPATGWLQYGGDAVTLFLVLSGFCLMLPVVRDPGHGLRGGIGGFFRRRAWRLLPAYYGALALATALLLIAQRVKPAGEGDLWRRNVAPEVIASHLLLIHNWWESHCHLMISAAWSLAVEWQIYFLFVFLLLPVWVRSGGVRAPGRSGAWTIAVGFAVGLAPLLLPDHRDLHWCSPWLSGIFAVGMVGAGLSVAESGPLARWRRQTPWHAVAVGVTILVVALRAARVSAPVPIDTLIACLGVALILACQEASRLGRATRTLAALLASPPLRLLGAFSYSLYLTHGIFLGRIYQVLAPRIADDRVFAAAMWVVCPLTTLAIAYVFFRIFERPYLVRREGSGRR